MEKKLYKGKDCFFESMMKRKSGAIPDRRRKIKDRMTKKMLQKGNYDLI